MRVVVDPDLRGVQDALTDIVVADGGLDGLFGQNGAVHFVQGRPSTSASATWSLVRVKACSTVRPLIISVAMELVAMAAPQPKVLNLASVMMLS